jgi:hypothetical protein
MFKASFKHIHDDTFLDPTRWDRDDIEWKNLTPKPQEE